MDSWGRLARFQCGVVSTAQLRSAGVTDRQLAGLHANGALERLHLGIHLVRGAPLTYEASLWAAVLHTRGVLGFATAAHLWGHADQPDRIDVIVGRHLHLPATRGVRLRRIDLTPGLVSTRSGLPVTSRTESLIDHLALLPRSEALRTADRYVQRGVPHPAGMWNADYVARQGGPATVSSESFRR